MPQTRMGGACTTLVSINFMAPTKTPASGRFKLGIRRKFLSIGKTTFFGEHS